MNILLQDTGLYWRALGGNNIDQLSASSYQYTGVLANENKVKVSSILVDLGKFDNHQALGIKNSIGAVPDVREILQDSRLNLKGVFVTHAHPDHLNGIIHYLRAGFKLPPIYGGRYTKLVLDDLYKFYEIGKTLQPTFIEINVGDIVRCGQLEIEVVSASHTCFDAFGFIIKHSNTVVYHAGDTKLDQTTYFKKPLSIKRIKELGDKINFTIADFGAIDNDGFASREADTLKEMVRLIKKSRKSKIFVPVYPTHIQMYILAFLAALKLKKNVVLTGEYDFSTYLDLIRKRGIDFTKISKNRIKIFYETPQSLEDLGNDFMIIGAFNDIDDVFELSSKDCFALFSAKTFFNPLKGQLNANNIKYVTLDDCPLLQGTGHGFLMDWEYISKITPNAVFIPTHCTYYVAEEFNKIAHHLGFNMIKPTPKNNFYYKLNNNNYELISAKPATWLVVKDDFSFAEVWQKPTSGQGFLKRTYSRRKTCQTFKMMLYKRRKRINENK